MELPGDQLVLQFHWPRSRLQRRGSGKDRKGVGGVGRGGGAVTWLRSAASEDGGRLGGDEPPLGGIGLA